MTQREVFEAWAKAQGINTERDGFGGYESHWTEGALAGWQAALQPQAAAPNWLLKTTQDLARNIAKRCYPEVPQFEVLDDLAGVISQIDNMTMGMVRQAAAEPVAMKQILQIYIDDVNAGDWHRPQQNYVAGWKAGYKHGAWSTTPPAHTEAMRLALDCLTFMWRDVPMNDYAQEKLDTAIAALEGAMK